MNMFQYFVPFKIFNQLNLVNVNNNFIWFTVEGELKFARNFN